VNIVFDLGGVVVKWEPDAIVASVFSDPATRTIARRDIIGHHEWIEHDRGVLNTDQLIDACTVRTGLPRTDVARLVNAVAPSLVPIEATVDLIRRLRAEGHAMFFLSNMPRETMDYLERTHDFWDLFDGAVVSARVGLCKPEPAIYEHLLSTYDLDPRETIFLDDVAANVDAARRAGMLGIQFRDAAQAEREIRAQSQT
jgi:HAD superfamily hydrolase (TIGR01509 family)